MDVSQWTLSRTTIESAAKRAIERGSYEQHRRDGRQKAARIAVQSRPIAVQPLQCKEPIAVQSAPDCSAICDTKEGAHPYMNLKVNQKRGGLQPGQESGAEKLDPKVGAMLKGLSDALARRGGAGV